MTRGDFGSYGPRCVYFIKPVGALGPVKIGVSQTPQTRLATMQVCSPVDLELVALIEGGEDLERAFHAKFEAQHIRQEWFAASEDLTAVMQLVAAGAFDISSLPPPKLLRERKSRSPEAVAAGRMTRALGKLVQNGVDVPNDVRYAVHTYGVPPREVVARRKKVADFVNAHQAAAGSAA